MPPTRWLQNLEDYYWLHDILRVSVGVPAWAMVLTGKEIGWRDLSLVLPPLAPYHFEIALGKEADRDAYHQKMLRKVIESGKPAVGSLYGFEDLFIPIGKSDKGGAVLYIGQFARRLPDWEQLALQWKQMSGREAVAADKDFDAYLSVALKIPVLPEKALDGLIEFGGLFAAHIRGESSREALAQGAGRAALEPRLDRLRKKYFTPYLPHPVWAYQAIGFEAQRPVPWYPGKELSPWMKEELGLSRVPTTVLAVLPIHADYARGRVINRALSRAAWAWCRRRGEIICEPMLEEGLAFLVPALPGTQGRLKLRETAEAVREFIRKEFSLRVVIGVGRPVPEGERLYPSYRQASLALQYALQVEKNLLFVDEMPEVAGEFEYARLARAAGELFAVFEEGVLEPLLLALNDYVRLVLEYSSQRLELMRGQFLATLFQLVEITRRRHTLHEDQLRESARRLGVSLESAQNAAELLERFKQALRSLSRLNSQGKEASSSLRLQGSLAWLRENFAKPVSLEGAARHAGLSVPGFTRAFRRATGSAFLPYMRALRVEQAQRLLRSSDISVLEIASLTGFSSSHHLIRAFKLLAGESPMAYRKRGRKLPDNV